MNASQASSQNLGKTREQAAGWRNGARRKAHDPGEVDTIPRFIE